jgi:hypothetical protein
VRGYFDTAPADALLTHKTTDGDHGRIEVRRAFVSHDVAWLVSERRFTGEGRFEGLAMIGMLEGRARRQDQHRPPLLPGLRPALRRRRPPPPSAPTTGASRGIENRLHCVMDVVFHDDLMRLRTGSGPANMATIRHAALNIAKEIPDKASLKVRRKTLGWDDQRLLAALTHPDQ